MKPLLALVLAMVLILPPMRWYKAFGHADHVVSRVTVGERRILVRSSNPMELPPVPGSPVPTTRVGAPVLVICVVLLYHSCAVLHMVAGSGDHGAEGCTRGKLSEP